MFIHHNALEPVKDHIPVLSPRGEAGRSIGLASHMRRDLTGELSFLITLEEYLNHDNFEWRIFFTRIEWDEETSHPTVRKATIQAIMAHHIRYIPKEIHE